MRVWQHTVASRSNLFTLSDDARRTSVSRICKHAVCWHFFRQNVRKSHSSFVLVAHWNDFRCREYYMRERLLGIREISGWNSWRKLNNTSKNVCQEIQYAPIEPCIMANIDVKRWTLWALTRMESFDLCQICFCFKHLSCYQTCVIKFHLYLCISLLCSSLTEK